MKMKTTTPPKRQEFIAVAVVEMPPRTPQIDVISNDAVLIVFVIVVVVVVVFFAGWGSGQVRRFGTYGTAQHTPDNKHPD
mmetsp:Transcript_6343/g.6257  ORF Transcript_6343/g.6257 Transcript_6343/m.6257 type:complete len:80 (+) Transcript_6343:388-627(+)